MGKPNSVRLLEREGVDHVLHEVGPEVKSGQAMAQALGVKPEWVLRTIVCELEFAGPAGAPGRRAKALVLHGSAAELDLKRLARAAGAARARLADRGEAERWTGLVRGGISALAVPPGRFEVLIEAAALAASRVFVSAGRPGAELELAPADLVRVIGARSIDLG
ncbi:YbaK/EbsC family protein [Engelhardtia mirabilis]|uniref:Cys-tRNA(Pro)/Cys-tRNA(Cys) deacylase YbaK n=1 Tax=Engelhardtia mirabilis TaxID=2528011 RepID=A0A518BMV6_9BACT|nr:Cys-tRNA(Pro)/Cys-tRNA(Cys) deacylase YbaK [Planctomycetes bacterium Pla133]QDV02613.1 Cys-tRNA(Pro)/Cys-tRNA(Cys) deacylase YbaK [Planctomycetes bacterium Pla86]